MWVFGNNEAHTLARVDPFREPKLVGSSIYFVGNPSVNPGLYRIDTTSGVTIQLSDELLEDPLTTDGQNVYLPSADGHKILKANAQSNTTNLVHDFGQASAGGRWFAAGDKLYLFSRQLNTDELVLRTVDTTTGDTQDLTGAVPGLVGAKSYFSPTTLPVVADDWMYFATENAVTGDPELWKTDGTPTGTVLLRNFALSSDDLTSTCAVGRSLFFDLHDPDEGEGLWTTDGTPGSSRFVENIYPWQLTLVGDTSYFAGWGAGNRGYVRLEDEPATRAHDHGPLRRGCRQGADAYLDCH